MVGRSRMIAPPQPERFVYPDESGEPVGCVDRHDKADGKKSFVQHRYERGAYVTGLGGRTLPLYRLPELRTRIERKQVIFIVEGERKADALAQALRGVKYGAAVTTIAGGANAKLTPEHLQQLRGGKEYDVLADSDAPGRKAARERAEAIATAYPDALVRIVDLYADRDDGSDVHDWLDERRSFDEFRALIDAAPRATLPAPSASPIVLPHGLDRDLKRARNGSENAVVVQRRALRVVDACDVRMVRPEWLEPGRIPLGTLTISDGVGGIGKTTFVLSIIACATVGRTLFDDTRRDPMNALVLAEEDDLGVLRAKLAVAGADLKRVKFVDASVLADDVGSVRLPRDVAALRELTEQVGAPVVYIDALFSHLELDGEGKMAHQMRAAIAPIARLARETGAAVMATRHWSKGAKSAADRGLGSGELSNVARSVLSFGKHPDSRDGDQRFVLATTKSNWSAKAPSLEYHLESVEVLDDNGAPWAVPRVVVKGVATGITADDLAMAGPQDAEERDRLSEAQDVILEALSKGELSADELEKRVLGNDVAPMTFRRARAKLRASGRIQREGGGVAGPVRWSVALPTPAHREPLNLTLQDEPEWQEMSLSGGTDSEEATESEARPIARAETGTPRGTWAADLGTYDL